MSATHLSIRIVPLVILAVSVFSGCANYGEKLEFNKGELYYTEGVSEADAKKLGEYLVNDKYFDGVEKSVQLRKDGDRYVFRAVILEEYLNDEKIARVFEIAGVQMSQALFNGAPVDIHLTDDHFETRREIPFNPAAASAGSEMMGTENDATASNADSL